MTVNKPCDKWERQIFANIFESRELLFSTFRLFASTRGTYLSLYIYNMLDFYERSFSGQMLYIFHDKRIKKRLVRAGVVPLTSL